MRIAIFGGSFDPVHNEHIQLVKAAMKSLELDKLFVMPAFAPPHKKGKILSDNQHRLETCRLAFSNIQGVEVSDYEIAKGGTSFTYLTCEYFRSLYKSAEIFWLVGTDMLRDFPTWKNPQSILSAVTLGVCARDEKEDWIEKERADFYGRFGKDFVAIPYNGAPVSSTKIRVLAGAGMDITAYTPQSVATYIQQNQLYEIANAKKALALEKETRQSHSLRVAQIAAEKALSLGIDEKKAITAALFHDCAKNVEVDSIYLSGFVLSEEWGEVPPPVYHQFAGAYLAERRFGVTDKDVLNAIRFHTSARATMSDLEKLIFLADMVEEKRCYEGVERLRRLFFESGKGAGALDACLGLALQETIAYLTATGQKIYPLTLQAYEYYKSSIISFV